MWLEVLDSLWQGTPLNWFGYINVLVYFLFSSPNKKYDKQVEVNNAFCTHQRLFQTVSYLAVKAAHTGYAIIKCIAKILKWYILIV